MELIALIPAGITFASTMAGGLTALRWPARVNSLMAVAGGVVLAAAFFDLLPDAVKRAVDLNMDVGIPLGAVLVGFLTFLITERLFQGHGGTEGPNPMGIVGALGFVIHSFFDGLAIGLGFRASFSLGVLVAVAVIAHDFSDGLNTISYLIANRQPESRSMRWLLADATTPLLGVIVATLLPVPAQVFPLALGFFSGLFVYAAAMNLLPRARELPAHQALAMTVGGALAMFFITRLA